MMIIHRLEDGSGTIPMTIRRHVGGSGMIQTIHRRDNGMILITHRRAQDTIPTTLRRAKDKDTILTIIHRHGGGRQDGVQRTPRLRDNPKTSPPTILTHHLRASGLPGQVAIQTLPRHAGKPPIIRIQMHHRLEGGEVAMILMPLRQGGETRAEK